MNQGAPPEPIRVLVADDHLVVRTGIVHLVDAEPDLHVVAEAANGEDAVAAFLAQPVDVTLMDLQMAGTDGIQAIAQIRAIAPRARIVVLTSYGRDLQAARAIRAGACAFLLKTMIRTDLLRAIRAAHAGEDTIPPAVAGLLREQADRPLSPREIEVLQRVADSGRNKQVAAKMGITEATIKVHMKNILAKLGAQDRVQAVMIALRRGIIDLER